MQPKPGDTSLPLPQCQAIKTSQYRSHLQTPYLITHSRHTLYDAEALSPAP